MTKTLLLGVLHALVARTAPWTFLPTSMVRHRVARTLATSYHAQLERASAADDGRLRERVKRLNQRARSANVDASLARRARDDRAAGSRLN